VAIPTVESRKRPGTWSGPGRTAADDLMRARHRLSKLLLRHGIVYDGGRGVDRQARRVAAEGSGEELTGGGPGRWLAFDPTTTRCCPHAGPPGPPRCRDREMAADSEFTAVVRRLGCLRGISTTDRVRPGRRDRRLAPVHRRQHRLLPRAGPLRVLLRRLPQPGIDHQDRQRSRPPAAGRGRLAPPEARYARQDDARPVGPGPAAARARGDLGNRRLHHRWVRS
jgi:transposase